MTYRVGNQSECTNGHDWSPTGVYINRELFIPCRRKHCKAELKQVWQPVEGPGMSINGMELDIEDDPLGAVAKTVCREAALQFPPDLKLNPGDVVIDIGAHVGVVSIYLAKRYPSIVVYAFEPVKANFERLKRNIEANHAKQIIVENMAITADGRPVNLAGNASRNSGGFSIVGAGPEDEFASSDTLSNVFASYHIDRCKILKIDCEGAEYEILTADESLLDRMEYLRGEFHAGPQLEARGWVPQKLMELCQRHIKTENILLSVSKM